jgi:KipI family sensor histidine kinase inhibitor
MLTCVYKPLGDTSFLIKLGETISPETNRHVHSLARAIQNSQITGLTALIPAYSDILAIYDPDLINWSDFLLKIKETVNGYCSNPSSGDNDQSPVLEIPVSYGGQDGPDLEEVALHARLSKEEVVQRHTQSIYRVYMMGFTPGFCYLGGLDTAIAIPRKKEPRLSVPAGSVGIAGDQTGIYPITSPGGWQIIGRTNLKLFDPGRMEPFLCKAGMNVRFSRLTDDLLPPFNHSKDPAPVSITFFSTDKPHVRVVEPGLLTTIQDAGRLGFRAFGMPAGGAMDFPSFCLANKLVGNQKDDAVLEMTFKGPVLEFVADTVVAVTGADMPPRVNGMEMAINQLITIHSGDLLSFAGIKNGLRAYLSVKGGFDVPLAMGSRSTYLKGKVGGYKGRALEAGDEIEIGMANANEISKMPENFPKSQPKTLSRPATIRFIPGPESGQFSINGIRIFLTSVFTVSPNSDRMGIRLQGPKVEHLSGADILSSGVIPGTIQIPGDGNPIILMNDCQTTGGYPRIGCVTREDLQLLAQLMPGDKIIFSEAKLQNTPGRDRQHVANLPQP